MTTGRKTTPPDIDDTHIASFGYGALEALLVLLPHLFFAFSVLSLLLVGYEGEVRRSRRVSVGPAREGRQLRLQSDAIVLEGGALAVAGKTEALQLLFLTPE